MISLFAALCFLTAVETSDISEVQVQTVRSGDDVTLQFNLNSFKGNKDNLIWYKQSFGKVPQSLGRLANKIFRLQTEFNDGRFNITADDKVFNLSISETKEEDSGTFYCAEMVNNGVDFISGRILVVEADERRNGEALGLQCSESSDGCEKISEAGSPEHSCSFTLLRRNLQSSHDGRYFCTGPAREEIRNRNGPTREDNLYVNATAEEGGDCAEQMHVMFWLSISRVAVLAVVFITLTTLQHVLQFRSKNKIMRDQRNTEKKELNVE